ncbi:unnamed protein product [Diplocarpon coronariae]
MSQAVSTQPLSSSVTEKPIATVGRKLRSVLGSGQQPSIRIQRRYRDLRDAANEDLTEKPKSHDAAKSRDKTFLARVREMFSTDQNHLADQSAVSRDEYDSSTVDILDIIALGLFITVYATLITLFGAAWVLFLIGWISLGSKQSYIVNVVDNVLVALFAIIGDGLAPFRAVDTYHMIYIAHYHRVSWKLREKLELPALVDPNDLPERREEDAVHTHVDIESLVAKRLPRGLARKVAPMIPKSYAQKMVARSKFRDPAFEFSVLTEEQQAKLEYHERKFSKSHTFYKPHETETHYAFPLKLLVAVVLLLDLHSCLQITLGACTWGINYKTRPFALTTVILCCSITANITAGILISKGDKRTRKHKVIERMMRQELTTEAIEEITKRRMKAAEERGEIDPAIRKRIEEEKERRENEEIKNSWKDVPLLPKTLLGKGVDNRQPSLPQEARRSSSDGSVAATGKCKNNIPRKSLPAVREEPAKAKTLTMKGEASGQTRGQRVIGFIRKADLDRS